MSPDLAATLSARLAALRARRGVRLGAYAVAVSLLVAAVVVVWQRRIVVEDALAAITHPAPGWLAVLIGGVLANLVLSAVFLRLLLSRYGRVGVLEMQAVVAASTLLNFLPLRPGLPGRIAYHRAVNRIAAVDTVKTLLHAGALSVAAAAWLAGSVLLAGGDGGALAAAVGAPIVILAAVACGRAWRRWALAAGVRYVELLVWAIRYHAAFALIDAPIGAGAAIGLACVSVIATMVPLVSNGLGLREWAVGLLAPVLIGAPLALGMTGELVNRAAELVIILAAGLAGMWWLARGGARRGAHETSGAA